MVVSKRCKICTVLDPDNIPISGEYFGKLLPDLIEKISGVELDPRKANGVLICQSCALQLVHIGSVVDKLRNTLQRLKKLESKSKTPAKSKTTDVKDTEETEGGETDPKPKTPKKVVRRKSVFPDDKLSSNGADKVNEEENKSEVNKANVEESKPSSAPKKTPKKVNKKDVQENGETDEISENKEKSKSPKKVVRRKSIFLDDKNDEAKMNGEETKTESSENDSHTNVEDLKPANKTLTKSPKKIVRRKSVIPEDKKISSDNSELDEIKSKANLNESKTKQQAKPRTPKKVVKSKEIIENNEDNDSSNDEVKPNGETLSVPVANAKFKKILDDEVKTPVKKTPIKTTKRKLNVESLKTTETISSPIKRTKTESINEESLIDCTIDENDGNVSNNDTSNAEKVKVMNCIICGKAFHQKSALRDHIETSHMGERLKSCPHCSSEFRSQQKYESHVFSEKCKSTNHACQYPKCNKRFKTVHKMEMHMHEKHSSQNEYDDE